jgi:sugar-phosphatase
MIRALFPQQAFSCFLFDVDGTILTSIAVAERVWAAWARQHGLDVEAFLPTIHGVRAVETIARLALPGVDPVKEAAVITLGEMNELDGVEAIAGAVDFLSSLPTGRWAVVTSAPRELAMRRIEAVGLPLPTVMIAAEDVERGKPAPDCFLLAAERWGFAIEDCLVFEDAAAGIAAAEAAAAEAAAASVLVITALHTRPFITDHPTADGYEALTVKIDKAGMLEIFIQD